MRLIAICFFVFTTITTVAQERVKKVEFYGVSKTNILHQGYEVDGDTMNISKANYGHSLIDLGILLRPSASTEIATELRLRNELGGFWGGAVSYGIRKLTLKGVVNDAIRYKVGDLDLEMTPYTLYNNDYQDVVNEATVYQMAREVIDYEHYYNGNAWRQQGVQSNFGFDLNSATFKSLDVALFSTRNKVADAASASPERLLSGGQMGLNTSYGLLMFHSVNLHDLKNTVNDLNLYYNSVNTVSATVNLPELPKFSLHYEGGTSKANYEDLTEDETLTIQDYFWNLGLSFAPSESIKLSVNGINTGPQFRSPSAQNVRLGYSSSSNVFPTLGNNLAVRNMGLLDYLYNDVLYYNTFDNQLDAYNPAFSNVMPYGLATPNRKGFSVSLDEFTIKEQLNLSSDLYIMSEIIGSGTSALKSFMKFVAKADYDYKKWSVNAGLSYESTSRDGQAYEAIELTSMLFDFGLDFDLSENISLLWGTKYHTADGNELLAVYDSYNDPLYFEPTSYSDNHQMLNSIGLMVNFNERSTLTASASSFVQQAEQEYKINQFQLLYRLNF
ncbi:MAG: hypothetical protein P8I29_02880 [Flavobacteriales bacterium]|jgi:hypothetical protein|nr:hypothetical protein [Flavobacteriales bacterium]